MARTLRALTCTEEPGDHSYVDSFPWGTRFVDTPRRQFLLSRVSFHVASSNCTPVYHTQEELAASVADEMAQPGAVHPGSLRL